MDFDGAYISGTGETVLAWVENPTTTDHLNHESPHRIEALQRGVKSSFAPVIGDDAAPRFGAARSTITTDGDEALMLTVIDLSLIHI